MNFLKVLFGVVLGVLNASLEGKISWKNTQTHNMVLVRLKTMTHLIVILCRPANNNRHHPGSPTLHPLHVTTETRLRFKNIKNTDWDQTFIKRLT